MLFFLIAIFSFAVAARGGIPYWAVLGSCAALSFALWRGFFEEKNKYKEETMQVLLPFFAWVAFFLVSLSLSRNLDAAGPGVFLFLFGALVFLLTLHVRVSDESVTRFLSMIVGIAAASSLIGVYFYVLHPFDRFVGTFADAGALFSGFPNAFANFTLFVFPLAAWLLLREKRALMSVWYGFCTVILFGGIILTFSRGAWLAGIAAAIGAALFIIFKFYGSGKIKVGVAKLLMIVLVGAFLVLALQELRAGQFEVNTVTEKAALQADEGGSSVSERLDLALQSLKIFAAHPFFGTGPETFKYAAPHYQTELLVAADHPHNAFLKILAEGGLAVALSALIFLGWAVRIISREFERKVRRHGWFLPVSIGLGAGFLHNMVDFNLNFVSTVFLFWFFLGLLLSAEAKGYLFGRHRKTALSWTLMITAVLLLSLSLYEIVFNYTFREGRAAFEAGDFKTAIVRLEQSRPLIFERELPLTLAQAYEKRGEFAKAAAILEPHIERGTLQPHLWYLAATLAEETDMQRAYTLAQEALSMDPKNNFSFYVLAGRLEWIFTGDIAGREEMEGLLHEYLALLQRNAHLTILTENPKYAIELARLLRRDLTKESDYLRVNALAASLYNAALEERLKITEKYPDISLPPL